MTTSRSPSEDGGPGSPSPWPPAWTGVALAALLVVGILLRLDRFGEAILGDELSTLFILRENGLAGTVDTVAGDAEISPPLYFVLAWLTTQLGSAPELVRLPALLAGVASIPLVYLVGARAIGRGAGLLATAVFVLSPFMIFYSADGRAYSLAIALLLVSTLAMLAAVDDGRRRWWVLYGVATCLAMYTHYTSAFVLAAQLGWLLWAHPEARRPALIANGAAAAAFLPWLPSLLADTDAPTIEILSALQGDGFAAKRTAVEVWAFGAPYLLPDEVPGSVALRIAVAAIAVATAGWLLRRLRLPGGLRARLAEEGFRRYLLVFALALATPVFEAAILLVGGTDLFGARNLNASSGGLALSIGAVLAGAGPLLGTVCAVAVLAAFGTGAARSLAPERGPFDLEAAAVLIDERAQPGDVVVDLTASADVNPVPLTSLGAHLDFDGARYSPFMPLGPPPFLPFRSPLPDPERLLAEAFEEARGERLFVVVNRFELTAAAAGERPDITAAESPLERRAEGVSLAIPEGWRVVEQRSYEGIQTTTVLVLEASPAG